MKKRSNPNTWAFALLGLLALAGEPSLARAGELQNLLDKSQAFAAVPKVKHTPAFRLESFDARQYPKEAQGHQWWYICDGQERVGLLTTWFDGHVELFRFSPEVDKGQKYPIPEVYHWANLIGSRLPTNGSKFTFIKDAGDTLEFKTSNTEFRLVWDERLGYVLYGAGHFVTQKPQEIEFSNLLSGGIAESRDDHKRWQKTVRGLLLNGSLSFVHHNPVNVPVDDVRPGAFVGFVTEEKMNPFVEVLEANGPVYLVTCSEWYDQHVRMRAPKTKEADGQYHVRAKYRLLSLPAAVARELEAMAVDRGPGKGESNLTGFLQNKVNDFETCVPHGKVYNGPIWQHINASEGPAHSGKKSIAVGGRGPGQVKCASPIGGGPPIYVESSKRYRLAAWVKTKGLEDGGAYLQADDVFYNWDDIKATRRTEKLSGDRDWTRLHVEFTPSPRDPLLNIKLCVEGTGTAWFDDLELTEVAR